MSNLKMSRVNEADVTIPASRRNTTQLNMNQFIEKDYTIRNPGYIDAMKSNFNIRIMNLNVKGLSPSNNEKIDRFIESIEKYQVDIMQINEVNVKWIPANLDKMKSKLKTLGREIVIKAADNSDKIVTTNDYLPGGVMTIIRRKCVALIEESSIIKGSLGNWIAIPLVMNQKCVVLINIYRIPMSNQQGPKRNLTQYNVIEGNAKGATEHRKEIFKQIVTYIKSNQQIDDVILTGDLNQSIKSNEVQRFFEELGIEDVHSRVNNIPIDQLDKTYINGSQAIDTIAMSEGMFDYVEGSVLLSHAEIVQSDHRPYLVDINLEDYFNAELNLWDNINHSKLDPSRKSHRLKFAQSLEDQLDYHQVENLLRNNSSTNEQIEYIDELITQILNKATKCVEGQRRNIPYSKEKAKRSATIKYLKLKIRKLKGIPVDEDEMFKLIEHAQFEEEILSLNHAQQKLIEAKEEWTKLLETGKEQREKDLIDLYPKEVSEEVLEDKKQKKRILKSVLRNRSRRYAFRYITNHIGRGARRSLTKVHVVNDNREIVKTYVSKEEIEEQIINYNRKHYTQAHQTKIYQDKIYHKLQEDDVREKILNGTLYAQDCDNREVLEFLTLLKNPNREDTTTFKPITDEDWVREVKRSKKASTSSIFSKRTYAVYKCALTCHRMTAILVAFYNLLLVKCYFPKRWQFLVDTTLEKGKGPILGKLRNITLIEGDLQINMRMQLSSDGEEKIEKDSRFSKSNYGSRKNYAIESAILQKRIVFDNSLNSMKPTIYNFTDLKSCYDRQLANIGSIVEESIGRSRHAMKLFTKLMPRFKHYISTGYGTSDTYYGGDEEVLAGTGQGNKFSCEMCRDISCLIAKQIEIDKLGMQFVDLETLEELQCALITYVDDTDMMTDGEKARLQMQKIIDIYDRLYGATGGYIEDGKSTYYAWRWKWEQGQKAAVDIKEEIWVNNKILQQTLIKDAVKSLGLYVNPTMEGSKQFEMVKEKLIRAMSKLRSTPLSVANAYIFFNMYLITQVYFGCGIVVLTEAQEKVLIKISESSLLRKLGLSERFPRQILYAQKSQLGVGIMKPATILAILSLKLYVGHKRHEDIISKQIKVNEKNSMFQYGFSKNILQVKSELKPKQLTWSDEIADRLISRNIKFVNTDLNQYVETSNKTIMDLATEYVISKKLSEESIAPINHVRLFKRMILPCELVGLMGNCKTKCFHNVLEVSSLVWKIDFPIVPKPSKKSKNLWKEFLEWMVETQRITVCDFDSKFNSRILVTPDDKFVKEIKGNETVYYEKRSQMYGRDKYYRIDSCEEEDWRRVIGSIDSNGRIKIDSKFPPEFTSTFDLQGALFPIEIRVDIENGNAFAASDASVKNNQMGGYWIITNSSKQYKHEKSLYHKNWRVNTSKGAEAITLLELISVIERKGRGIERGKIIVAIDNRKVHRGILSEIVKPSTHTQDAGAEIAQMKKLLKKIRFEVEFNLVKGHKAPSGPFQMKPLEHLIRMCDEKARVTREKCSDMGRETNIKYVGFWSMEIKGILSTNSVKEAIRIVDAEKSLEDYVKVKYKYHHDFIDLEARRTFNSKEVTPSIIKCAHGFNHYGVRDALINKGLTEEECPRCNQVETWDHVIKCGKVRSLQREFVKETTEELLKQKNEKVEEETILEMMEDICKFFEGEEDEYETTQQYVGFKALFRGYAVKDWKGADVNCKSYTSLNKILVKRAVLFYGKCWNHRNEICHDEEKQRERLIKWYEKIKTQVEMHEPAQVKLFVRRNKIDVMRCKNETIRMWIHNVNEVRKKVEKLPLTDIRRHFEC